MLGLAHCNMVVMEKWDVDGIVKVSSVLLDYLIVIYFNFYIW